MFIFLSYAHEDSDLADRIRRTLLAAGFDCFLDRISLPAAQEYNARISQAIARADLFIFLVSAAALEPGSYTLTELTFAEKRWRNPAGYVLPVVSTPLDLSTLPAYLRSINVLQPRGNIEAEVLAWVEERAEHGGGGGGEPAMRDRLTRWARQHQPPLRRQRRLVVGNGLMVLVFGFAFVAFGILASTLAADTRADQFFEAVMYVPILVGFIIIIFALVQSIRGLVGAKPVAALVLDRTAHRQIIAVHLLLSDDTQKAYTAIGRAAKSVYPGDIGWAFVTGGLLLGFERGQREGYQGNSETRLS